MENKNELVVESNGHCFLCLIKILPQLSPYHKLPVNIKSKTDSRKPCSSSIHSLQRLSRHLEMDMRKVFRTREAVPPHLLEKVAKSELKAELCEKCARLVTRFSVMFRRLEKIEMEVRSCLSVIQSELSNSEENGMAKEIFLKSSDDDGANNPRCEWVGKIEILDVLRKEAIDKCSRRLANDSPRVQLHNLTTREVDKEKRKFKLADNRNQRCLSPQSSREPISDADIEDISEGNVKVELHPSDSLLAEDDDNQDYSDMHGENSYNSNQDESKPETATTEAGHKSQARGRGKLPCEMIALFGLPTNEAAWGTFNPETKRYQCSKCGKEFADQYRTLPEHYRSVHLQIKYKCTLCKMMFTRQRNWDRHYQSVHIGKRLQCGACNRLFKRKEAFMKHQKGTTCMRPPNTEKYVCHCHICGRGFTKERNLERHIKELHLRAGREECGGCGRKFARKSEFKKHQQQCTTNKN